MKDLKPVDQLSGAISERTAGLIEKSVAANTVKSYRREIKALELWLEGRSLDDPLLSDYISELFYDKGKAPSSIAIVLSAIKWRFPEAYAVMIVGEATQRAMAGIRREGIGRGRGQMDGLSRSQVDFICALCEKEDSMRGLRDASLIRLMSDCLLRVGEAVAVNIEDFRAKTLTVIKSKTDQEGAGATLFITATTRDFVRRYLESAKIEEGALFRRIFKNNLVGDRLTTRSARQIIKDRAANAGLKGQFSGHSLRIGTAESLAQVGATLVDMQTAGRWKDPKMPAHYARSQIAEQGAVARFFDDKEAESDESC